MSAKEELPYLKEIFGADPGRLFPVLIDSFNALQNRAQMMLGLITICLTITGFSGPQIAASGPGAKLCILFGLVMVMISAVLLLLGPLQLRWGTQRRAGSIDETLVMMIERRNVKTSRYHAASFILVVGLVGYLGSVIAYLLGL